MRAKPLPSRNGHDTMRAVVNWSAIGVAVLLVLGAFLLGCVLTGGCVEARGLYRQSGR